MKVYSWDYEAASQTDLRETRNDLLQRYKEAKRLSKTPAATKHKVMRDAMVGMALRLHKEIRYVETFIK